MKWKVKVAQSRSSMEFSRPEYWSRLFPSPGDLPNPGIETRPSALQADSLPTEPPGKPKNTGVGSLSLLQRIFATQNQTGVSSVAVRFLTSWDTREALNFVVSVICYACMLSHFSHVWLFATPWTVAYQAPLSMGFSKQGYWSRLPYPSPWDLLYPGIESWSLKSPALASGFFTTNATWEAHI